MDALGRSVALIVVAMAVLCPLSFAESDAAAEEMDGLMLYQVNPFDCEGVAVHNYGSSTINLEDYAITDMPALKGDEGKLTFGSITIKPGETLVISSDYKEDNLFANQENTIFYGGDKSSDLVTKNSKFAIRNDGDDIYLFLLDGRCVDAVCYGDIRIDTESYWTGDSFSVKKNKWIERSGTTDTNTADDWFVYVYGRTNYTFDPDLKYDAMVTPFLFPDSGGIPIFRELEGAQESIRIEMYQLMNKNVLSLLCDKAAAGIDVDILLEGESLSQGYHPILDQQGHYKALLNNGADIRLIGVSDNANRYDFDHAKFALIDGKTTIVTSENWTQSNLNGNIDDAPLIGSNDGNRGWGAIIDSTEYTKFMNDVFENDWSFEFGDVKTLQEEYPNLKVGETYYKSPETNFVWKSYSAKVTPVLSDDSSYNALEYYVSNAKIRAYSEQQSLSSDYFDIDVGPVSMFAKKASTGVDTRLIFNDDVNKNAVKDINASSKIKTAQMSTPNLHNKGVICDNISWVSSVNWTPTSFHNNREVCAVIDSNEVADYFATAFITDFDKYYTDSEFEIEFTEISSEYESGQEITVSVDVTPNGEYTYEWDLGDGSKPRVTDVPRIVAKPTDGKHTLVVIVTDSNGFYKKISHTYTVGDVSEPDSEPEVPSDTSDISTILNDYLYYIIAGILVILGIVAAVIKGVNR